jgi:hypothetical protein
MPHRALSIVLGVVGLLAVLALILARVDPARAARGGSAWRRRVVAAGLALLSALGLDTAAAAPRPEGKLAPTEPASSALSARAEWKRVLQIWAEADAIASGSRGDYPFNRAGQTRVLTALDTAGKDIDALVRSGALSAPEGGLLKQELQQLRQGVGAKHTTEMRTAKCYEAMMITVGRDSLRRLRDRLPLLEKLAASKRLEAAVVLKVLARIESDVQTLEGGGRGLSPAEQKAGRKLARAARAHIAKIRALLRVQAL